MTSPDAAPTGGVAAPAVSRRDALVAGVAVLLGFVMFVPGPAASGPPPSWAGLAEPVLAVAQGVPLVWRRRRPERVAAAVLAAALAHAVLVGPVPPFAGWIAVGAVVRHARPVRRAALVGAAAVAGFGVVVAAAPLAHDGRGAAGLLSEYLLTVVVVLAAALLRTEHERLEALRQRAASLERERDGAQRRAAAEERLRIARDLHDLVGHGLATIAVQSSTARVVLDAGDVAEARRAVAAVEASSRSALAEMRQLLGVLRGDDPGSRAPSPGLGDLTALADGVRRAGVPVSLDVVGDVGQVPPAVALSLHRVVQESLTNVLRHAPEASAAVRVDVGDGRVRLAVRDDGGGLRPQEAPAGPGHGLVGMAERVRALGGDLHAGPAADTTGWLVEAVVPLPGGPTPTTARGPTAAAAP